MSSFEFLTHVVIVMLFCCGFYVSVQPGKLFAIWQNAITEGGADRFSVSPALGGCLSCSGSLFGSQYFLFVIITNYEFNLYSFLPFAILAACMAIEHFAGRITFSRRSEKEYAFHILHMVTKFAYVAFLIVPAILFVTEMLHIYIVFLFCTIGGLSLIENSIIIAKAQRDALAEMEVSNGIAASLADDYFAKTKTKAKAKPNE